MAPYRYCSICAAVMLGIEAVEVQVQVHLTTGKSHFHIVGLGDTAVKESSRRVMAALKNSGFHVPSGTITVNLAPALLHKSGTGFDLPIALGILVADGTLDAKYLKNCIAVGELGLDGSISLVRGMVGFGLLAREKDRTLLCAHAEPLDGLLEVEVCEIGHLGEIFAALGTRTRKTIIESKQGNGDVDVFLPHERGEVGDYADVIGQQQAIRALTIAAAGQHNILMVGPPGTGKTMLASRLPSILPPLSPEERIETALVNSVAGKSFDHTRSNRPFRAPHHSSTTTGIVGGGNPIGPGEVSLAHNGVLFLDEMPQFSRLTLQSLRQPLEDGTIRIVRASAALTFPARVMLVAAANPCPCGYLGDKTKNCRCLPGHIEQYQNRIGGPLMDRFDMSVIVARPNPDRFFESSACQIGSQKGKERGSGRGAACHERSISVQRNTQPNGSIELAARVAGARHFAERRKCGPNRVMSRRELTRTELIEPKAIGLLKNAAHSLDLSGRGIVRCLRLARTIADLDQVERVTSAHISEALSYRGAWSHHA